MVIRKEEGEGSCSNRRVSSAGLKRHCNRTSAALRRESFGPQMAEIMRFAGTNVEQGIVPNSGHWIMEENPTATIKLVTDFLAKR